MSAPKTKAKLTFDTLSALRPRKIDPKYAALGQMTRMVEAAERKSQAPGGKPNTFTNKTAAFLERMATRAQPSFRPSTHQGGSTGKFRSVQPLDFQSRTKDGRPGQGPGRGQNQPRTPLSTALDTLAARKSPTGATGPSSERFNFRRDVASLDKLAAAAGIDASAGAVQKRRTYGARVAERQREQGGGGNNNNNASQSRTRFALPQTSGRGFGGNSAGRRMGAGRPGQGGAAAGGQRKTGDAARRPTRPQSKGQMDEAERQRQLQARREQTRPEAVNYSAPSLNELTAQLTLAETEVHETKQESGWASYKAVGRLLAQGHDATMLVATNRSIVPKQAVLRKISHWLPEVTPLSSSSQPRA